MAALEGPDGHILYATTGFHSLSCWGGNQDGCDNALIDGFVIPIGAFGGKGIEEILAKKYGKQAVKSFCEAGGDALAELIKNIVTGRS